MQPSQPATSPFRQKIFTLMNQQHPSKVIKVSQKMHHKTINTTLSPFKEYSIDTDLADSHKLTALNSSSGVLHFKSLQQKLGLKNASNEKSRGKQSSSKSSEKCFRNPMHKNKKVSFVEGSSKFYYKPPKTKHKSQIKHSNKKQLSKSSSCYKLVRQLSPKPKLISKTSSSKSLNKSQHKNKFSQTLTQQNSRKPFEQSNKYLESGDKQTQKKNYLLQTLKKMESVRRNLTKTFQQFDREQSSMTERIGEQGKAEKEKSKSNLTVISDFVNEENESVVSYGVKKEVQNITKSKSKTRLYESTKKSTKQKSPIQDIFHKKTPSKNHYITSQQSFTQNPQNLPPLLPKNLLKSLILSCKHPEKWQTLLQNDLISILFRIVKRKLIEIEIHAEQEMNSLEIELEKGALVCQSLKQRYEGVRRKQIITLLCSVRGVEVGGEGQGVFDLPKLLVKIEAKIQENSMTFRKQVDLPYSWVMVVERKKEKSKFSSSKKHADQSMLDRVKTHSALHNLSLSKCQKLPNLLQILSYFEVKPPKQRFPKKQKKMLNSSTSKLPSASIHKCPEQDRLVYSFELEEQQFILSVKVNSNQHNVSKGFLGKNTYNLELEGKGEALMGKLLLFLELLS